VRNVKTLEQLADGIGNALLSGQTALAGVSVAMEVGDTDAAERYAALAESKIDELGQPVALFNLRGSQAALLLLLGRLDDARVRIREYLELGRTTGQPEALLLWAAFDLEHRRLRGRLTERALLPLRESPLGTDKLGAYSLTRFLYEGGEHEFAREQYEVAMSELEDVLPARIDSGPMATNLAFLCARFGDRARAAHLTCLLQPHSDQFFQAVTSQFVTWHYLGMLAAAQGHKDHADDAFERAIIAHERARAPLFAAESRVEWAQSILRRPGGQSDERVAGLLRRARVASRDMGAIGVSQRVEALDQI
jgi:tetratricopeptide (TPR) repeat protein